MKKRTSIIAIMMATLLCGSIFAGCTDSTTEDDTESSSNDTYTSSDEAGTVQTGDVIGMVTSIGDSYLTLDVYETDTEISNYAYVEDGTLYDAGYTNTVTLDSDATYEYASDGYLYYTTLDDIAEGDMVAVTEDDDGVQEIIILSYTLDSSSTDSEDSTDDSLTDENA